MDTNENLDDLCNMVKDGDTVYTIVRSVAKSGMSRRIDVLVIGRDGPRYLTSNMASLGIAGMRMTTKDWAQSRGAMIPGCGMDMGFHAVDSLQHTLGYKRLTHRRL